MLQISNEAIDNAFFSSPVSALADWSSEVALVTAGAAQGSHPAFAAGAGDQ